MSKRRHTLVLAIYPHTRGLAFVVFEGPLSPYDWGLVEARGNDKNAVCMQRVRTLLEQYRPDALVVQKMGKSGTTRGARIQRLNQEILMLAAELKITSVAFSREEVHHTFNYLGALNKQVVAETLARHIPAFEQYLPPPRKLWRSEDPRLSLFEAAALVWKFFQK